MHVFTLECVAVLYILFFWCYLSSKFPELIDMLYSEEMQIPTGTRCVPVATAVREPVIIESGGFRDHHFCVARWILFWRYQHRTKTES